MFCSRFVLYLASMRSYGAIGMAPAKGRKRRRRNPRSVMASRGVCAQLQARAFSLSVLSSNPRKGDHLPDCYRSRDLLASFRTMTKTKRSPNTHEATARVRLSLSLSPIGVCAHTLFLLPPYFSSFLSSSAYFFHLNATQGFLAAVHAVMAAMFLLSAYVNLNDPDPELWISLYLTAAAIAFSHFAKCARFISHAAPNAVTNTLTAVCAIAAAHYAHVLVKKYSFSAGKLTVCVRVRACASVCARVRACFSLCCACEFLCVRCSHNPLHVCVSGCTCVSLTFSLSFSSWKRVGVFRD